jgi:hypothetical protein
MPDVTSGTGDLRTRDTGTTSWSDTQGSATTSGNDFTNTTVDDFAIYNLFSGGRSGTNTFTITRSYFPFDLSGLTVPAGQEIISATLTFHAQIKNPDATGGHVTGTAAHDKIYIRGASTLAGNASDFGNVYSSGTTKFASFGSGTASTTEGDVVITLNSDGLSFLNNVAGSGTATIAALGFMDDQDTAPGLENGADESAVKIRITMADNGSNEPTLSMTFGVSTATPTTYNNIGDEQVIKTQTIVVKAGLLKF